MESDIFPEQAKTLNAWLTMPLFLAIIQNLDYEDVDIAGSEEVGFVSSVLNNP
jgi:hypothetical protein